MKREKRFRYAMVALFAASSVAAIAQGYSYQHAVSEYAEIVKESDGVIGRLRAARKLYATLFESESGQRGYLLTGNPVFREKFTQAAQLAKTQLLNVKNTQPLNRFQEVNTIELIVNKKLSEMQESLVIYDENKGVAAADIVNSDIRISEMGTFCTIIEKIISDDAIMNDKLHGTILSKVYLISNEWIVVDMSFLIGLIAGITGLWRASRKIGELSTALEHEVRHDMLTGLPNRLSFQETLDYLLALAEREDRKLAIIYLDLDGFKSINDRLGHDIGDMALIAVANALKSSLRHSDLALRYFTWVAGVPACQRSDR